MSYVLIESQIFYRQPYLTQSISILSYAVCVLNFSNGAKTRPWQNLPRFVRTFQIANDFMPFIWKASEVNLNEFTAAKYKYSEKVKVKSGLFSLNTKKM